MTAFTPDKERLEQEWAADQEVLRSLHDNGDNPDLVRPVDVSFRGTRETLEELAKVGESYNLNPIQLVKTDDGQLRLDTRTYQTTNEEAIRALTLTALQIEAEHQVIYDGWGCVAVKGDLQ